MKVLLFGSLTVVVAGLALVLSGLETAGTVVVASGAAVFLGTVSLMSLSMSRAARRRKEET